MRLAIVGSREITDPQILLDALGKVPSLTLVTEIVSGGAKGVDALAKKYAEQNALKLVEFLPDYGRFGRGATLMRNTEIIEYSDIVLAIPLKGKSKGTYDDIRKAEALGKQLIIHEVISSPNPAEPSSSKSLKMNLKTANSYKLGEAVLHDKFGEGKIANVDGPKLTIDFGETGAKTILCSYKGLSKK